MRRPPIRAEGRGDGGRRLTRTGMPDKADPLDPAHLPAEILLAIAPGISFAVAQSLSIALLLGLRLAAEGTIGDRLGVFGASTAASTTGSPLALRTGATLSTDLDVPLLDTRFKVGLGISTTGGLAFGSTGAKHPCEPADCKLSLDIGRVGDAPLWVSAPCQRQGTAGMPITFGIKTEF